MDALTPIILHTQLEGKKTAVSTLTQGDQVVLADGSTLPQALARVLAAAVAAADVRIVPDIAARDTLSDKHTGVQVWVRDATADPTVARGAAKYLWDQHANEGAGDWLKTAESESMDVVVLWAAIHGIPQVLNYLDISSQGLLTFNGETVYDRRREVAVVDSAAPVPLDMREGALVLERTVGGDDVVPKVVQGGVPLTIVPSLRGPQGPQGVAGDDGVDGGQGLAATITVGSVATGAPGSAAAVTNAGSAQAAVLDFTIPQGPQGMQGLQGIKGDTGAQGIQGVPGLQGLPGLAGATPTLNNTTTSSSITEAATANAVRVAYDKAAAGTRLATTVQAGQVKLAAMARDGSATAAPGGFGLGVLQTKVTNLDDAVCVGKGYFQYAPNALGAPTTDQGFVRYESFANGAYGIQTAQDWGNLKNCFRRRRDPLGWVGAWERIPGGITDAVNVTDPALAASATAVKIAYDAATTVATQFSPAYTRGAIAAYANYVVPGYIVGTGRLQVWLDGLLCECGGNAALAQYQEVGAAGTWNNAIQWHNYIDTSYDITARVR